MGPSAGRGFAHELQMLPLSGKVRILPHGTTVPRGPAVGQRQRHCFVPTAAPFWQTPKDHILPGWAQNPWASWVRCSRRSCSGRRPTALQCSLSTPAGTASTAGTTALPPRGRTQPPAAAPARPRVVPLSAGQSRLPPRPRRRPRAPLHRRAESTRACCSAAGDGEGGGACLCHSQ